jgi:hypothetical protein
MLCILSSFSLIKRGFLEVPPQEKIGLNLVSCGRCEGKSPPKAYYSGKKTTHAEDAGVH